MRKKQRTIADRLSEARSRKFGDGPGATADAARAMGIPLPTYFGHENGHRVPRLRWLILYAEFYDLTLDYLILGKVDRGDRNS